jgi:predicted LPLAT superfamily acyltransferase
MTAEDLGLLIAKYRAGLQAELRLLEQLTRISARQRLVTHVGNLEAFIAATDERETIMLRLVRFEERLRGLRQTLTEHRPMAASIAGFDEVARLHREAALMVNRILATDKDSMTALAGAEFGRRAVASLERGDTTLAAYRGLLSPTVASAALVDRRG